MRSLQFLRSAEATLIVLALALVAQLPHAADVFRLVVGGDSIGERMHSYSYAIALELAVLLFVVQHRNIESYVFAVVSILINLSYYHLHDVALFAVAGLPAWLISVALPAAIARYSHAIADKDVLTVVTPVALPVMNAIETVTPVATNAIGMQHDVIEAQNEVADMLQPDQLIAQLRSGGNDERSIALQLRNEFRQLSNNAIAKMLDVHAVTVGRWLKAA